ncbi:hypothetical protein GCM10008090_01370 [Arenicella chitinivorans]|uniref:Uncharacterized protein n=1 Tax=Arenicella chitinivorans TaxID=1329800 RepID=A0A918RJ56_9GAMM|nr:hypothetical protein GCM10008090_01370 [Arenicella chitinivorans]
MTACFQVRSTKRVIRCNTPQHTLGASLPHRKRQRRDNEAGSEIIYTGGGVKELGAMDGVSKPRMNLGSNNNEDEI